MTGISERIESVLAELKISRRELSRRAGLSPSHVEQLTAGRVATPSAVVISAIAHAAGVSVDWLATGAGPRPCTREHRGRAQLADRAERHHYDVAR